MARIYNKLGSLSDLISEINDKEINNLKDVINFKNNLNHQEEKIVEVNQKKLEKEIIELDEEIKKTKNEIKETRNRLFQNLFKRFKNKVLFYRINKLKRNPEDIIKKRSASELEKLKRIDEIIIRNRLLIYGSVGELKVIKELKKLSDDFYVINNYKEKFPRPIYNKKNNDYIYSIQIDHLIIGPTGLFIIETKNWSKKTIKREDLFSPVKQIERAGFALFVKINNMIKDGSISTLETHWGARKVSPQKIIALIKGLPDEKYQYVKIIPLDKIVSYIENRKKEFSKEETKDVAKYLLRKKDQVPFSANKI